MICLLALRDAAWGRRGGTHDVKQGALPDIRHECNGLCAARSFFRKRQPQLVACKLQIAEHVLAAELFTGLVVDQAHLFAAAAQHTSFQPVDPSRQTYRKPFAHAGFRPSSDKQPHQRYELSASDRIDVLDCVVRFENVIESEACGELQFRLRLRKLADFELIGIFGGVSAAVRVDEIRGDVT